MNYGLTEKGFIIKPFEVILQEEQDDFRVAFGNDIDLSDTSIEGVYIKNQAIKRTQLWEQLGKLYAIGDVDDAFGIYLDRLVNFLNVERLPAGATRVYECLWAEEGTKIPANHLLRLPTGETFKISASAEVTVSRSTLLGFLLSVKEAAAGDTYQLQIDKAVINYSAVEGDDEQKIQDGIAEEIEKTFPDIYEIENTKDGLLVYAKIGLAPFSLTSSDKKIEFPLLGFYAVYTAVETGAIIVSIGALNEIVSKVNGLDSAVNYASGITGRDRESDTELRMNLAMRQKQATANEIAIQNEILKVDGVEYARVYSNRTNVDIKDGRPAKSYEAVVVGGDEQAIAEIIFEKGPAGIQPYGNITKKVVDSEGFTWDIGFSRPKNKYIWIKVEFSPNNEESLPTDMLSAIQDNIMAWSETAFNVGSDLIYQKLYRPVYDVQGIGFVDIKIAVTDSTTPDTDKDYKSENIEISEAEIAVLDKSRISVLRIPE